MRARQADELLHEQLMEEKRAIEEAEWFRERQAREIELAHMECECRTQMLERKNAAREFLDAEERQKQEQERADPAITKGPL